MKVKHTTSIDKNLMGKSPYISIELSTSSVSVDLDLYKENISIDVFHSDGISSFKLPLVQLKALIAEVEGASNMFNEKGKKSLLTKEKI